MKIYKKAVLAASIFVMAAGAAMTAAGAQETYLPPVMVQGTVSEKQRRGICICGASCDGKHSASGGSIRDFDEYPGRRDGASLYSGCLHGAAERRASDKRQRREQLLGFRYVHGIPVSDEKYAVSPVNF